MTVENLWGEIPSVEKEKSPIVILKEQASLLGQMTNNILTAQVVSRTKGTDSIDAVLDIIVPALDFYRLSILETNFDIIKTYPLKVRNLTTGKSYEVKNEQDFKDILRNELSSNSVQKVLGSLLMHAKSA
ncbi:hypothetical protein GF373_00540 [bacterium]|nr:hypothetical protein [bacterium]